MEKTKLVKRASALIIAVILTALCFAGCGSKDSRVYRTYQEIKDAKKIIIGVSSDNNPFGFADENGEYQGYEIVFAKRLAEEMKLKPEFVSVEAGSRAKYLETGKADVVISDYAVDSTEKKIVDFAQPYMKSALAIVSHKKDKVKSLDDLDKKDKVIVVSGSEAALYIADNYKKVNLTECADVSEAVDALENNMGVVWLGKNTEVAEFAMQNEGYSVGENEIGEVVEYAPAVSKGNKSLIKQINKIMDKLYDEDFFSTDYDETLETVYGEDFKKALVIEKKKPETETKETTESGTAETTSTEATKVKD
ncbi:MAG: transporter substrate-binding domain-containing protein [Ruminococcus sp.]|nr:transporter substrate-binding domain-containing protein [Ruminococcus sp.]